MSASNHARGAATHFGTVVFEKGAYRRASGSTNWKVMPIAAFDPPIRVPVGQVQIEFDEPARTAYSAIVTAVRTANTPLLSANCGHMDPTGFVVHLWETIADRTLQNGSFSFAVLQLASESPSSGGESMDIKALLRNQLDSGMKLLMKAAETLSEDDFHAQLPGPGPSANWIFGHLAVNEDWFVSLLTGQPVRMGRELIEQYQDDASFVTESASHARATSSSSFSKSAILEHYLDQRKRTLEALAASEVAHWDSPLPTGIPPMYKNLGGVWGIVAVHPYWHLGQLMSIRHMLHKPPLSF